MKDDKLKSYLKNRLGDYTHPADDALWSSIAADALPKSGRKAGTFSVSSRKGLFWIIGATSAAAILLLALFVFNPDPDSMDDNQQPLLSNVESTESESLLANVESEESESLLANVEENEHAILVADAENVVETAQGDITGDGAVEDRAVPVAISEDEAVEDRAVQSEIVEDNQEDGKRETESGVREDKSEMRSEEGEKKKSVGESDKIEEKEEESVGEGEERKEKSVGKKEDKEMVEESDKKEIDIKRVYAENRYMNGEDLEIKERRINKKLSMAVSASGYSISSAGGTKADVGFTSNGQDQDDDGRGDEGQLTRAMTKRRVLSELAALSSGGNHQPPINVAISVRKKLDERFYVEGGLSYTYLHSKFDYKDAQIKMHYLGLQVKGVIMAYNNDKVALYGNFGGMLEKNIAGRYENRSDSGNFTTFGLQISLGVAAGMEVKLAGPVGIFVEPGFAYFFDDGADIAHIREDNPYNYNLQIGLRFNIN